MLFDLKIKSVNGKVLTDFLENDYLALAMGADGVLIARPYVTAVYGGGEEGVKVFTEKFGEELKDTMSMCGAFSLKEITRDMVRL